ncbi:hypothetical protein K435DRAFT_973589 [Dendrothele bispora CBS 962.96]|uniref:Zn(2)-C6 fungal-type domain-containing protein n=1 Tax=Dendrothele bispora (strain CBS 962.96) TaxID=1314807 RepID=A0A4S8KRE0_DENBC|nr:hypothetical protein K435DRAFT_973589 [Dendrothele bispora CBS 962.96]
MFKYISAILLLALVAPAIIQAAPQAEGIACNPDLPNTCPPNQVCCDELDSNGQPTGAHLRHGATSFATTMSENRMNKKRRFQHACDECRRRKVRCDSENMPNNICSSCLSQGIGCKHSRMQQKRGPKPAGARTDASQPLDVLVTRILQSTETNPFHVPDDKDAVRSILFKMASRLKALEKEVQYCRKNHPDGLDGSLAISLEATDSSSSPGGADSESVKTSTPDETNSVTDLSDDLAQFTIGFPKRIHFGESSNIMLVMSALNHRKELSLPEWKSIFAQVRRPKFWEVPSWPLRPGQDFLQPLHPNFTFPESSLMQKLIHHYFLEHNVYCPLLHRPSFEKSISSGLHLTDSGFGSLVLVVCAMGARNIDFYSSRNNFTSDAGWEWFNQIPLEKIVFEQNLSLYHLQMLILSILYLKSVTARPSAGWVLTGIAMRIAQERGVHRRPTDDSKPTVERELWKRAFWMLVVIDTRMSSFFGRPRATSTQDFDLSPLIECDDEFWETEDPEKNFQQPVGKPSLVSFWNCYTRLFEIVGFSQRTIYSVRKSELQKKLDISSSEWHEKAVLELDSALNKWADSVPPHLRWDIDHLNETFFSQSAVLYTMYYWVRIQIHRRFIPRPGQKSEVSLPSLTICTNAARSCIKVCDAHCQKKTFPYGEFMMIPLFNSAMILTVNLWRATQNNANANTLASFNPSKELAEIYKCVELIRIYEPKYSLAGRLIDIINTVISASHHPSLTSTSGDSSRITDTPNTTIPPDTTTQPFQSSAEISETQPQEIAGSFHLPLYTNELGSSSFSLLPDTTTFDSAPVAGEAGQAEYDKPFDPEFSAFQSQITPLLSVANSGDGFHIGNEQISSQGDNASSHTHSVGNTGSSNSLNTDTDMLWPGDPR